MASLTPQSEHSDALRIGRNTQRFMDDFIIASIHNLKRVMHHPLRHPGNPVITGTEPWEKWTIDANGLPALYDEDLGRFRMWYVSALIDDGAGYGELHRTCYAESKDGIHWTKPDLGQVTWAGSGRNNLTRWGESWMRRPSVLKDIQDPDPTRRYKMTYSDLIAKRTAIVKAYSIDGIHWRLNGDGQPWFRKTHNHDLMGWDPCIQQYVLYVRMPVAPTAVGRSTSPDFVTWSEPETVLAPDPQEGGVRFQGLSAFLLDDLYVGLVRVLNQSPDRRTRRYDVELAFSRDGIQWVRYAPGDTFFKEGEPDAWDCHSVYMPAPVIQDDKIWFYYTGQNHEGGKEALKKVQRGWEENGTRMQNAIGLATLRRDGFVSLDAGNETGWMETRPLMLPEGVLEVNADIRGELRVEIRNEAGDVLTELEAENCRPIRSDAVDHTVLWNGRSTLDRLKRRAVRLRFLLRDGRLYAFRFR